MKGLKIEIHLLQSFPPSCLNRDDTNTPKTCEFGGYNRARVSSQCWKRAIRDQFIDEAPERAGTRTKRLKTELIDRLVKDNVVGDDALRKVVEKFVLANYAGMDKKRPDETNVLVFYSPAEFETMVGILKDPARRSALAAEPADAKTLNEIKKQIRGSRHSLDVALFARMLAENPDLNVDGACQVAHAISTHAVNLELDFFTAVDDFKRDNNDEDAGAGMMGTIGYDSACYYRYALVDFAQLRTNLQGSGEDAGAALAAFLRAFCEAVPGAKRTSFAPGNPPFAALFVVRDGGMPASLVNAFARPVDPRSKDGLLAASARALARQAQIFDKKYDLYEGAKAFHFKAFDGDDAVAIPLGQECVRLKEAISNTLTAVAAWGAAV